MRGNIIIMISSGVLKKNRCVNPSFSADADITWKKVKVLFLFYYADGILSLLANE